MASIASSSPSERLVEGSRYVIVADLRMGDGGPKDELVPGRAALLDLLKHWYLPRGYTLVLAGDVEDLREFWLKDIRRAWRVLYSVFDAFAEAGRLRKIVGERDMSLLRLRSQPYELSHGLRLDGANGSILVLHGHQASLPYAGRDYLGDYLAEWELRGRGRLLGSGSESKEIRAKAERRLYKASSRLGLVAVEGHTRRPLFESRTTRDSIRSEIETLIRGGAEDGIVSPSLFCPGRLIEGRGRTPRAIRALEIEGDRLSLVRWCAGQGPLSLELGEGRYSRSAARAASISELLGSVELLSSRDGGATAWGRG